MALSYSEPPKPSPYAAPTAYAPEREASSRSWVWLAVLAGHLSAGVYLLLALGCLAFFALAIAGGLEHDPNGDALVAGAIAAFLGAFSMGLVLAVEAITIGMHRRHRWAFIAGLAMFAIYLPSLFILFGAMGFIGLLAPGSRREFGMG